MLRTTKQRPRATALTIIKAIAAADGVLKGSAVYLTKLQMIHICNRWLADRAAKRNQK